jgi:hypothetical protein
MSDQGPGAVTTPPPGEPDAAAKAPRHRVRHTVLVAVGLIGAIAAAAVVGVDRYQPLGQSLEGEYWSSVVAWNSSNVSHTTTQVTEQFGPHLTLPVTEDLWTEPTGAYDVEAGFTLSSVGPWAVTIDAVGSPMPGVARRGLLVFFYSTKNHGVRNGPRFHPFALAGRGHKAIVVEYTKRCTPSSAHGPYASYSEIPVTYSFLGLRHTVGVPIEPYEIKTRPSCH